MKIKTVLSFLFFVLSSVNLFSQSWKWAKNAPGTGTDGTYSVSTDAAGNVFVTGKFSSPTITFGSTVLTNAGLSNIFIAKYDANGNVLWAQSAGGIKNDVGYSVSTDIAGNVFVAGNFSSPTIAFGPVVLTNTGFSNIFLAEYDANGNVLWAKRTGGKKNDAAYSVSTNAAGNVFLTGYFQSDSIIFGSVTLHNAGVNNVFIVKYDANGNVLWAKSAGGFGNDGGYSISADASGNVFVTGGFGSAKIIFGSTILTNAAGYNVFIAKYDPNGNVLWAKSAAGTGGAWGYSVSADAAGNVFVTGDFYSRTLIFKPDTLTNADPSGITNDVFIAKYDALGNVLWVQRAGGTGSDGGYSVSTDAKGNAYVTGAFLSSAITFGPTTLLPPPGSVDPMFIARYDPNGNVLCASALASGGYNQNAVSADTSGNAYVGSSFKIDTLLVGNNTLSLAGKENVFVAKYICKCTMTASVNGNTTICSGQISTLTASAGESYLWNNGSTADQIFVTPTATSSYSVIISSKNCSDTAAAEVIVSPIPVALFKPSLDTCNRCIQMIDQSSNAVSWLWSFGDGSDPSTQHVPYHCFPDTGVYNVTLTVSSSPKCKSTVSFPDSVFKFERTVFIPNVFSPNGDGVNDMFKISGLDKCDPYTLKIYDRWGILVFETERTDLLWDGTTRSGLKAQEGTYYYTLSNNTTTKKGFLTLLR